MKKHQLQRSVEQGLYTLDQLVKAALVFIPNGQLIDSFIHFNSGLKQERILGFVEDIKKVFETGLGKSLDNYNFETEDFVDLFDSIMRKVQYTKSKQKLEVFKGIFVNAIVTGSYDLTQVYIDLTSNLHEKQIDILLSFINTNDSRKNKAMQIKQLSQESEEKEVYKKHLEELARNGTIKPNQSIAKAHQDEIRILAKLTEVRKEHERIVESINPQKFGLEDSEYNYFVRDLLSKGLLIENTYVSFASTVVESIDATDFAIAYHKFVVINA
jgi:hypothetical protein